MASDRLTPEYESPPPASRWDQLCSIVPAPELAMDQAKGSLQLRPHPCSAFLLFSILLLLLSQKITFTRNPTWYSATREPSQEPGSKQFIVLSIYIVLRASLGDSDLLMRKQAPSSEVTQWCPEIHTETVWSVPRLCPITHTTSRLGTVSGWQDQWAHPCWMGTSGMVAGSPVLHIDLFISTIPVTDNII